MRFVATACLAVLISESLMAADWRFRPRVTVSGSYSDNVGLSATDPENDFITDISPGFTLNGTGRRFSLDIFYNLQYLNYARNTAKDTFRNQFQLIGNGEVAEDLFFIDLRGTVRQTLVDPGLNVPVDTLTASDNITNTYTFGISPYLVHRFGSAAEGEARYAYDRLENSTGNSNTQSHTAFLNLRSGSQFQVFTWDTFYRYFHQIPESGLNDVTFQRVQANGRYHFNRKVAALFGTGYEDNEFVSPKTDSTSAVTWLLGLSLTPNDRTFIEGGAEERFFGTAPFLNATYTSNRTALAFHYSEELTTTNQVRSDLNVVPLLDPFGNPILDPNTGNAILVPIDTPGLQNEVMVRRRFDGSVVVRGRRSEVGVTLFDTQRSFQVSPDEEVYGLNAYFSRRLSRLTTLRVWGQASRSEFDGPTANRNRYQLGIGFSRQFSKDFSGRVDYRYLNQDSKDPALDYDENRVTLSVNKYF